MDTYRDICESNKHLYAQMEQYSWEISYCLVKGLADDAELLNNQKEGIGQLININLEKLDEYWENLEYTLPNSRHNAPYYLMTSKELKIIEIYKENPNNTMKAIASSICVSKETVSRTITKYLTDKYGKEEIKA